MEIFKDRDTVDPGLCLTKTSTSLMCNIKSHAMYALLLFTICKHTSIFFHGQFFVRNTATYILIMFTLVFSPVFAFTYCVPYNNQSIDP